MPNNEFSIKSLWPVIVVMTVVVAGIGLIGRWQTEGFGSAGEGLTKRKNFPYRDDYGYPERVKY